MGKKQLLIETAFMLFYQNGIHAVGINQILETAKVAKKTLYTHFSSKEALVAAVLAYRDQQFMNWLETRMRQADSGYAAIMQLFDAIDDWINNRVAELAKFNGCFFINTCAEYGEVESVPHQLSLQHKLRVKELVENSLTTMALTTAQQSLLLDAIMLLKEGAIVSAQVQGDQLAAQKAKQIVQQLLSNLV